VITWWICFVLGMTAIGGFLVTAFVVTVNKMVSDELRARLDDIPALLVTLALWCLPEDQREFYRPDWEGSLLVAFNEKNDRYPVTKVLKTLSFVAPLFFAARTIRRETALVRKQGLEDESLERLGQRSVIGPIVLSMKIDGVPRHFTSKAGLDFYARVADYTVMIQAKHVGTRGQAGVEHFGPLTKHLEDFDVLLRQPTAE